MNRRTAIPAVPAAILVLGLTTACGSEMPGGTSPSAEHTRGASTSSLPAPSRVSPGRGSQGGAPDQPDPRVRRHPHVSVQLRTHPRLRPGAGGRNTTFVLSFTRRRNLGPHGHVRSYYGVIVSPVTAHPHHGCYGFGRYVLSGRRGQLARVALHPRGRLWCVGTYQATVYLTGKPYCPPSRQPHPCSTSSYSPRTTGWTYFTVR